MLTRFKRLKKSPLNSALTRSLKRISRATRRSKLANPGPSSVFRPRSPGRSESGLPSPFASEPAKMLNRQQRAELEIAQEVYARGNLADESQREPVRHSLARDGALRPDARPFGQVGQVRHRFRVVDGLRERIAPVKTEPAREPLLDL